jgi:hypothetical protein
MDDIREHLAELRTTVEQLKRYMEKVTNDHEHRIRYLERWAWALPPAVIASAISALAALVSALHR